MGALLTSAFFTDKVRSAVTALALLAILTLLVVSWAFPRHPKLDDETIQSLKDVTATLNRTASTLEQQSRTQADLNEALKKQLADAETSRNKNYAQMLQEYGLPDIDLPTGAGAGTYPYGLPTPDHDQRGDLYLQAQAQQVQINSYKSQLQDARARLTQVIPAVKNDNPVFPVSLAPDLSEWLHSNDCTQMTGDIKDACYKVTRVKLINTTQALDNANANIYAGQVTVNQLISNIGVLIDGLGLPDSKKVVLPK